MRVSKASLHPHMCQQERLLLSLLYLCSLLGVVLLQLGAFTAGRYSPHGASPWCQCKAMYVMMAIEWLQNYGCNMYRMCVPEAHMFLADLRVNTAAYSVTDLRVGLFVACSSHQAASPGGPCTAGWHPAAGALHRSANCRHRCVPSSQGPTVFQTVDKLSVPRRSSRCSEFPTPPPLLQSVALDRTLLPRP